MHIDVNADVGEGYDAVDEAIAPLVSSVNIACGAHAGDAATMERTVALALRHGLAVGAHPGYPDREGFGRRAMDLDDATLRQSLREQLSTLSAIARRAGARVRHVKPHGALYNRAADDRRLADLVAGVVRDVDPNLVLVGLAGSRLIEAGRAAGLRVAEEAFADRAYEADGRLRSRDLPGALLTDPRRAAEQALAIARDGRVPLAAGGWLDVHADSLCLHADTSGAVENARAVRAALEAARIAVRALDPAEPSPDLGRIRVVAFGERALLVELGDSVDAGTNAWVHRLARSVDRRRLTFGAQGPPVPAYASLLVPFDPAVVGPRTAQLLLEALARSTGRSAEPERDGSLVEIPTRYGGSDGPDLEAVADRTGLGIDKVIDLHSGTTYRVFMLGFAPGFAYLGTLAEPLRLPRREEPRVRVPVGSVAIAGAQTAVYPHATPGGWHLIGRTELPLWSPRNASPACLQPGDRVRFVPA